MIPIAGLEPQTIVIPSHKTDPMPIGSTFILQQLNKGPFTIVPADDEVTVGTSGTSFTSGGLFALVQVIQLKQNTWWVSGCLK